MPTTALGVCVCGGASAPHWLGVPSHQVPTVVHAYHASPAPHACFPPLSYVYRLRGVGGIGVLPASMCPLLPWVCGRGLCCGHHNQPHTLPTLPPLCAPAMRPRPRTHAFCHSPMYVDCGARAGKGCCLPTCAHYCPGCVGGDSAAGTTTSHTPSPRSLRCAPLPCVPGPTRMLSATLL